MTDRFCKDCFYGYERTPSPGRWYCQWPGKRDLTSGLPVHTRAQEMRQNGIFWLESGHKTTGCGTGGQWFEGRNTALGKHLTAEKVTQEHSAKAIRPPLSGETER